VYGLIRQESRFIRRPFRRRRLRPDAGDAVHRQVGGGKIGLADFVHGMLSDIRTNITLGTNYMNMVLNNAGSQVLATAAYNAGPAARAPGAAC
jgi:soluble lytic murein transglycosylase